MGSAGVIERMNISDTVNFTKVVWRIFFPEHTMAPRTLCYDPLCSFSQIYSGLSHIAHGYYTGEDQPDDQIYIIDRQRSYYVNSEMFTYADISKLPQLECILFISYDNDTSVQQVLEKLESKAVVIVMHECVKLPKDWIPQHLRIPPELGITTPPKDMMVFIRS